MEVKFYAWFSVPSGIVDEVVGVVCVKKEAVCLVK
jgi:hypothetical protein